MRPLRFFGIDSSPPLPRAECCFSETNKPNNINEINYFLFKSCNNGVNNISIRSNSLNY